MRNIMGLASKQYLLLSLCLLFLSPDINGEDLEDDKLSDADYTVLKVCEGVIQLFKQMPDSVWPGYDLSKRPFIVYIPEKWTLLLNYSKEADGFTSYPEDWPALGTNVLFHKGQYKDLAGQLAFYVSVDTMETVAVSFLGQSEVELFGYIIHEALHRYQYDAFGEIPWEREQKYPIQDRENTAFAYLEMRLLMDALRMATADDREKCLEYVKQFVAVRNHRWKQGDPFVAKYEQGQEINEGTAEYVEMRGIELMTQLEYESSLSELTRPLSEHFSSISMPEFQLSDFQNRITENSVSPEDMPRNRIYPVASAQGFLLDYFNIDWKSKAQQAGSDFTFARLFRDYLGLKETDLQNYLERAKENYNYEEILTSTDMLITAYIDGFSKELESFESQAGYQMEIDLRSSGIYRSRHSRAKKWVVDKGTRELCKHFNIYSLKSDDLLLQVRDTGLLEQNDWDKGTRKVVFFIPELTSIILDGEPVSLDDSAVFQFGSIEILGQNLKFSYSKPGNVTLEGNEVKVNLIR